MPQEVVTIPSKSPNSRSI